VSILLGGPVSFSALPALAGGVLGLGLSDAAGASAEHGGKAGHTVMQCSAVTDHRHAEVGVLPSTCCGSLSLWVGCGRGQRPRRAII
jgi:hypothetical protein